MTQSDSPHLRGLLDRLARLAASEAWSDDLTPTQLAALDYLAQANRFSRAPSQVADYLGATRGTVSQTLKTLEKKRLVTEERSSEDKRRISYSLTPPGHQAINTQNTLDAAIGRLTTAQRAGLTETLESLLKTLLTAQGGRSFGICHTCRHHSAGTNGQARCTLLDVALTQSETTAICHEHQAA